MNSPRQRLACLVALSLIAFLPSCDRPPRLPDVVLIVVDTLRADHLGCYGYQRATSPSIDALAETATLHERSLSTAPWTIPTHASMFTGKFPYEHGARTFRVETVRNNCNRLSSEHLTLAEALSAEGYATGAFVANAGYLAPVFQLDQGFSTYQVRQVYAESLNEDVFAWLDQRDESPFFLFVNYIDTHKPYNVAERPHLIDRPVTQDQGELVQQLYEQVMPGEGEIPVDLVSRVIDQYDTAIANVDEQVGRLLDRLRDLGRFDPSIVIVTSDHGEFFGEHHLVEHSKDVYQEVLRVPLVIKAPGQQQADRSRQLVASNDLPGLILSSLPAGIRDRYREYFPDLPGNHPVISENYYTRVKDLFDPRWGARFQRARTAIFDGDYKYIHSTDGQHELFDLADDPTESVNLFAEQPEIVRRLEEQLAELHRVRPPWGRQPEPPDPDDELQQRLRSLGYVGAAVLPR